MTDIKKPLHKLPVCLQGVPVNENDYPNFWTMITSGATIPAEYHEGGAQLGVLFEGYLFRCAKTFVPKYELGAWNYFYCKRGEQLFYLKPTWAKDVVLVDNTLTDKDLDSQAFGFYITLYALHQYRHVAKEAHWDNVYAKMIEWAKRQLSDAQGLEYAVFSTDEDTEESKRVREAIAIINNITLSKPQTLKSIAA